MNIDLKNSLYDQAVRILNENIDPAIYKNHLHNKYFGMVSPVIVYICTLFDFQWLSYCEVYNNVNISSYLLFWPSLSDIIYDLRSHGDVLLSCKYYLFSLSCFVIALFASVYSGMAGQIIFLRKVNYHDYKLLRRWYMGHLAASIIIVCGGLFVFNDAGYGNESKKFLIFPQISKGEFFFLRDMLFFILFVKFASESVFSLRVLIVLEKHFKSECE